MTETSLQCFDAVDWAAGRASGLSKIGVVECWHCYLSGARCRLAYGPADNTATHCLLPQQIPIGFTFLVPVHPCSPGQRAVKQVLLLFMTETVERHTAHSLPPPKKEVLFLVWSVCLFVCLSTRITRKPHYRTSPIFSVLTTALARSSSGGVAVCYVLPVL